MKKIFRNLKFGLMLCAGAFAASCSDVDDAMDDIPYTRVLTPLNFEATVDAAVGTDIKFSWSAVSNADAYILELFEAVPSIETDDSGKEVEVYNLPEYFDSANAYKTVEVAKDAVPYTVKNLAVDMTFWARVRGVSERVEGSHWACLSEPVSTSAVRAALNPKAKERTSTSVLIEWDEAEDKGDLTSIRYEFVVPVEGATATTIALSDEQINACEALVEGLEPGTNYKFTLLFGKSGSRGVLTAYTRPNVGEVQRIKNTGELTNAISSATGDLELLLEYNDGELYDCSSLMTLNASENIYDPFEFAHSLAIYGESTSEGAKPVVKLAIKPTEGCEKLHFEDVTIDGGNQCGVFVTTGGSLSDAEFVNCEITGFTKGIWSGATGCNVSGTLLYENIYAHDINPVGAGGGDFIDIRGGNYGAITVQNSTFYACARSFLRISEAATQEVGSINVANCTFNQVTATNTSSNNSGIFHIRYSKTSKPDSYLQLGSFVMSKCVFLNMNNANETENAYWVRLTRDSNENIAPKCEGNIYYNIGHLYEGKNNGQNTFFPTKSITLDDESFTSTIALAEGGMTLTDDPCTNSIAGKMYLKNGTIAANKAGDPRWWNASAPVVVRPTELETITEDTTWDFTDKTKFDTESVEETTIIENIRIYAPAEIVMNEGIAFSAAATVNTKGVPLTSALAFNAEGYGSIEVTAQGTGITSTVQIIAGGDAYSINADGQPHKVVLGDLVGANDIYVLPSVPNINFTKIAWTKDTTPEVVTAPLATPVLTINVEASIEQGTEQEVKVTWENNPHAATYTVTFNGATTDVTEPEFVIDATTVAGLAAGEYPISVVAKPTPTSTKYTPSEAGETSFKIRKPVVGIEKKIMWDFTTFDGTNITGGEWTSGTALAADITWNIVAETPLTIMNGVTLDGTQAKMADGNAFSNGSTPTRRALAFVAPGAGTLTIVHKSGNATATDRNTWVSVDGNVTDAGFAPPGNDGWKSITVDLSDIEAGKTVYIFTKGNNFQSVEYTYYALPQTISWNWDFGSDDFKASEAYTAIGTSDNTAADVTYNKLHIQSLGSNMKIEERSEGTRLRTGGGSKPTQRAIWFEVPAACTGKLAVNGTNPSGSTTETTVLTFTAQNADGSKIYGTGEHVGTGYKDVTVFEDVELAAGDIVYICCSGGYRYASIDFSYTEQ